MKLSNFSYSSIIFSSNSDKEKIVFDTHYPRVEKPCDYGIVFGGVSMIPYRTNVALDLYQRELVDKLVLTGGVGLFNKDRQVPEAYKMYEFFKAMGVLDSDLIMESHSRNTSENVKFLLEMLEQENGLDNKSFAVITSDFHVRRCIGALRSAINIPIEVYASAAKDGVTDLEHWHSNHYGRRMILTEALLLLHYAKLGLISNLEIPDLSRIRKR